MKAIIQQRAMTAARSVRVGKRIGERGMSTNSSAILRRCMLYVPGSFVPEKLAKTLATTKADSVCFDLEDSVALNQKSKARENVVHEATTASSKEKLVRINSTGTSLWQDDMRAISATANMRLRAQARDIHLIEEFLSDTRNKGTRIIASIESAIAIQNLKEIANASPRISALLFAAEDYCADVGIQRSSSRSEMLYARSAVVTAAKAYKLQAIDLVCISLKNQQTLAEEAAEGRRLGFNAKQAIHPAQVDKIQSIFGPSAEDIARAQAIIQKDKEMQRAGKGAFAYTEADGTETMIDAPMLLQARAVMQQAQAADSASTHA